MRNPAIVFIFLRVYIYFFVADNDINLEIAYETFDMVTLVFETRDFACRDNAHHVPAVTSLPQTFNDNLYRRT
jgi:hypothetical protein